jgi:hypothetical protein
VPSKQTQRPPIDEDLLFQQRNWRVQRIGWMVLGLLIVAGLAGLMGPGPLSRVNARAGERLEVDYERFVRHGAASELKVTVRRPASGQVRVAISRDYLDQLNLERVRPSPTEVQSSGGDAVYVFGHAGGQSMQATFVIQPEELGSHVARVAAGDGSSVTIRQFTYP